jgi:competence protein ComEA
MLNKLVLFWVAMMSALACAAVDVNQATPAELDSVNGIGPGIAARILEERKKASFKDWADLEKRVPGIKDKRAVRLSDAGLTVNGASYGAPAPTASQPGK